MNSKWVRLTLLSSLTCVITLTSHAIATDTTVPAPSNSLAERAAQVAAALTSLNPSDLYFHYSDTQIQTNNQPHAMDLLHENWTPEEIRPLLHDPNPKIRTLGIILMFDLDRLDVLADIAPLMNDTAETFPRMRPMDLPPPFETPSFLPRKVADWATAAIASYVPESPESQTADSMRAFAAARDPRLSTAALVVQIKRANRNDPWMQPDASERVFNLLEHVKLIPMPRRFFVRLRLNEVCKNINSTEELLGMARQVPRDVRLAAIHGKLSISDPDLTGSFGAGFILTHAVDLLQSSDAEMLVELERQKADEPGNPFLDLAEYRLRPDCFVLAAAALRPEKADEILIPQLSQRLVVPFIMAGNLRADVAAELAQLGSDRGIAASVDWFFQLPADSDQFMDGHNQFLARLHDRDAVRYRQIIARLIRDKRLTTLDRVTTSLILESVEGYLGRQLVSVDELHPGVSLQEFFLGPQARSETATPVKWHQLLQQTVDEWDR